MSWLEHILEFLRHGPKGGKLDMNALFQGAVDMSQINKSAAIAEIDALIQWQEERKKWHADKTRQKMAAEGNSTNPASAGFAPPGSATFRSSDFGLDDADLAELRDSEAFESESESGDEDEDGVVLDPIALERKRRVRRQDHLRRTAGEPVKPEVRELGKLREGFLAMLRMVLAE